MANRRLRHSIAFDAARLMYERVESEYYSAKRKAAKRLCKGQVKPSDLPSNSEIRELVQVFARTLEGDSRTDNLKSMRLEALRIMRLLRRFRPRLIGSVLTGHVRRGSDIDIHLFTDSVEPVTFILEQEQQQFDVEYKTITKHNETRTFTHVHVYAKFDFELTAYPEKKAHYVFKSSITGKAIERANIRELEQLIRSAYPEMDLEAEIANRDDEIDPWELFRLLLIPLDRVKQSPKYHPEGDVQFHSLQVFELARDVRPYDEEFLLAALLHDIGKGIDPANHVAAAIETLESNITDRTAFLIANHMIALEYKAGTLGRRQRQRLEASPDFEDLMLLRELDSQGRVPGAIVGTIDDAIDHIKELSRYNHGEIGR